MTAAPEVDVIAGIYDIKADDYHRDPVPGGSLSSTGARKLVPPSCPALYRHWADHPQPPKRVFDIGTALHTLALGDGPSVVAISETNYKTAAAQAKRDAAYAAGKIPLLPHEKQLVEDMAAVLLNHPRAGELLAPGWGEPEQTYIWRDEETGVWCRSRPDLADELLIVDIKTTTDASPQAIEKSVYDYGYQQQQEHYRDGHRAIYGTEPRFLFLFQAKTPPYPVTVVELDDEAAMSGYARNRRARHTYAACMRTGEWPDFGEHIHQISLPSWAEKREEIEGYL